MEKLLTSPDFWAAITHLAWPLVLLILFFQLRPVILAVFSRQNLTIKVAGMEVSVSEAAQRSGEDVAALQERLAKLEINIEGLRIGGPDRPVEPSFAAGQGSKRRILWVDDYPSNNAFGIERLESKGIFVRKELSTDAGIRALTEEDIDLIITDLGRVESGEEKPFAGLELVKKVRAKGLRQPIIVFAGPRGLENRMKLLNAGADEVTASMVDVMKFIDNRIGEAPLDTPPRTP